MTSFCPLDQPAANPLLEPVGGAERELRRDASWAVPGEDDSGRGAYSISLCTWSGETEPSAALALAIRSAAPSMMPS